ncbi:hypothetical protein [Helicobacter cetorum]|uniref:hypothetical protein n=1 Tax=Helicobacter cetorum TaxID=138563 RepID=UPI0013151916|nr:hypothetical protein [Helicobacter cetorum]
MFLTQGGTNIAIADLKMIATHKHGVKETYLIALKNALSPLGYSLKDLRQA